MQIKVENTSTITVGNIPIVDSRNLNILVADDAVLRFFDEIEISLSILGDEIDVTFKQISCLWFPLASLIFDISSLAKNGDNGSRLSSIC